MFNRLFLASAVLALAQMVWAGNAKYFFVMIPPEMEEWMSSVPMLSMDGGVTGKPMKAVDDMCGWFSYTFADGEVTDNVVLYRSDDPSREDMIGVNGNWETAAKAQPIPLGMIFDMGVDSLFFVPDENQKTNDDGYYYSAADVSGIAGTCSYSLAAVIYDTDPSLHPAFSCYVDDGTGNSDWDADCQIDASAKKALQNCLGVTPGMVEETLGADKKPKLNKSSAKGMACFQSAELFDLMFTETSGVNEMSCYDMPFKRSADGRWKFDSDYDGNGPRETVGGFFPREYSGMTSAQVDAMVIAAGSTPLPAARTKHPAQGPAPLYSWLREVDDSENASVFDLMCNGSGWDGGINCATHFASGNDLKGVTYHGRKIENIWCWGDYCFDEIPSEWPTYSKGTEKTVARSVDGAIPRWESGDVTTSTASTTVGRNQHFCFESHAQFTYKQNLRFSFSGNDDIWVFIGGKLAVDLGGMHLPAPAYVDLSKVTDATGNKLVVGDKYDLDIFFCNRRTPMSNVRVATNMYIVQRTAIDVKGSKNPSKPSETSYNVCYTKTGDGSCAAALSGSGKDEKYCGDQMISAGLMPTYTLVKGNTITSPAEFADVKGGLHNCGIDLTNPAAPKIDKDNICGLGGGRYTLFVNIEGKSKKVATFRMTGDVDVVYADATIVDTTGAPTGSKINLKASAMAGDLVPVYISSVAPADNGVEIFPDDAVGVEYTLSPDNMMTVYEKVLDPVSGSYKYDRIVSGTKRTIGASGIDTVYVTVDMDDMDAAIKTFKISVSGRQNAMTINFYLTQISFIQKIPEAGEVAISTKGLMPNADGSYEEYWVGSIYDMYLAIVKPNPDGTYSPCIEECNGLVIHKGAGTSPKIDFIPEETSFDNGYAKISVRSLVKYRWDTNPTVHNPATIVAEYNDFVQAFFTPMYFRDPPVPFPVLADVFDVHGSLPEQEFNIPAPYFDMNKEYLDGIGDSVAIYYERPLHKDSLPTKICIMWDSTSAEEHDPVAEGFSNIPNDSSILCNELVTVSASNIDCANPVEVNGVAGYCPNLITIGGLKLSEKVKTSGVGKVYSYTVFEDKGKEIKQGFAGALADRIAPVPLRAQIRTVRGGALDLDSLVVVMSEPVKILTTSNRKNSLDFYLNSAIDLAESNRFISALGGTEKVSAEADPMISTNAKTGEGRIKFMYRRGNVSPHVGDYLRLGGDLANILWSDDANVSSVGVDSLRAAADAAYHWNSPTAYNETKRLPSRWIPIKGDIDINSPNIDFAEPTFRVVMTAPFQFTIVLDWESNGSALKKYAVMDLQGRILQQGTITSAETVVPVLTSGSYVVKVGHGKRLVNVH